MKYLLPFSILLFFTFSIQGNSITIPTDYPTIQQGIDAALDNDTVHVLQGIYLENLIINNKTIFLFGDTIDCNAIIDGQNGNVITCVNNSSTIIGFTILSGNIGIFVQTSNMDSMKIQKNIIKNNKTGINVISYDGQGAKVIGNWIENNTENGGIQILDSSTEVYNNIIIHNNSNYGGAIYCVGAVIPCYPEIINNTIVSNSASEGGGIFVGWDSHVTIMNNIISQNMHGGGIYEGSNGNAIISFNNVWNRPDSNYVNCTAGTGDISNDPLFVGVKYFNLASNSPCIDVGNPDFVYNDPDGSRNDLGATGGPYSGKLIMTEVNKNMKEPSFINHFKLSQNYPNPFNSITTINYSIQKPGFVSINILDISGKKIKTLVNQFQSPNSYSFTFKGNNVASGIYFCQLHLDNNFKEIFKMILIK